MGADLVNKNLMPGKRVKTRDSKTSKLVVTLPKTAVNRLKIRAGNYGVGLPTYCRILLSEMAEEKDK